MKTGQIYLDEYEVDGENRWNWKLPRRGFIELVSQEFQTKAEAVDAWENDQLVWETPPSFD